MRSCLSGGDSASAQETAAALKIVEHVEEVESGRIGSRESRAYLLQYPYPKLMTWVAFDNLRREAPPRKP